MKKQIHFVGFAAALLWTTAIVLAQDQAPAPSYKDGDSWQFKAAEKGSTVSSTRALDGDYEVSYKQGDMKVVPMGREKGESAEAVGQLKRMLATADEQKFLEFPLTVGKKWSAEYKADFERGTHSKRKL